MVLGSTSKSDKCPQVVSIVSASVGSENYKFENLRKISVIVGGAHAVGLGLLVSCREA